MDEWNDPEYVQVLPDGVDMKASAGRQMEGFLDVSHFAFVHEETFGEVENQEVPDYAVTKTPDGFVADYFSTVSNYSKNFKHLNPPGFIWRRRFEVFFPFTAKLTVTFPGDGQLHILNAVSPVSARRLRLFGTSTRTCRFRPVLTSTIKYSPRTGQLSSSSIQKIFRLIFMQKRTFLRIAVRLRIEKG
jgi:phenylpropionate dioxygenase-like ring-hydroxylating dioxygenase large terminal subunit